MDAFKYSPLNAEKNEIRVLRLDPPSSSTSAISAHLEHIPLDALADYTALSYTWGDNKKSETLILNGSAFAITKNLAEALRVLRNLGKHIHYLWIDAICINQDDPQEKSHEVLRMFDIYLHADRVIIWLGEATEESDRAIEILLQLSRRDSSRRDLEWAGLLKLWSFRLRWLFEAAKTAVAQDPWIAAWCAFYFTGLYPEYRGAALLLIPLITHRHIPRLIDWTVPLFRQYPIIVLSCVMGCISLFEVHKIFLGLTIRVEIYEQIIRLAWRVFGNYDQIMMSGHDNRYRPTEEEVRALRHFFNRPWFYRIWILQEISVAKTAMIMCGYTFITWAEFHKGCDEIDYMVARCWRKSRYMDTDYHHTNFLRRFALPKCSSCAVTSKEWSILNLLCRFSTQRATDPRDKIYALLGLAREMHDSNGLGVLLSPDYTKPLTWVYADFVRCLVQRTQSLAVLRACDGLWKTEGLPSWACDWTRAVLRPTGISKIAAEQFRLRSQSVLSVPVAQFSDDLLTMSVRGFSIGRLNGDGEAMLSAKQFHKSPEFKEYAYAFESSYWYGSRLAQLSNEPGSTGKLARSAHRLLAEQVPDTKDVLELYEYLTNELAMEHRAGIDGEDSGLDTIFKVPRSPENLFKRRIYGDEEDFAVRRFKWNKTFGNSLANSAPCITLAAQAKDNDLICMLVGAIEPHLLRKCKSTGMYLLVGPVTLGSGLREMWTECEREYDQGSLRLETFTFI